MKTPKERIQKYIVGNSKWNQQTYPAKIISITPDKVAVSGYLTDDLRCLYPNWEGELEEGKHHFDEEGFCRICGKKVDKFTAEVENVRQGKQTKRWFFEEIVETEDIFNDNPSEDYYEYKRIKLLKINQSCLVTEPVDGKCKIIELK